MVERGERLGFALESGAPFFVERELGWQRLDSGQAPEAHVPGAVHLL